MTEPPVCEIHGIPLVCYCPACRGATGGKVSSPAKVASSRENVAKARAVQAKKSTDRVEKSTDQSDTFSG